MKVVIFVYKLSRKKIYKNRLQNNNDDDEDESGLYMHVYGEYANENLSTKDEIW